MILKLNLREHSYKNGRERFRHNKVESRYPRTEQAHVVSSTEVRVVNLKLIGDQIQTVASRLYKASSLRPSKFRPHREGGTIVVRDG